MKFTLAVYSTHTDAASRSRRQQKGAPTWSGSLIQQEPWWRSSRRYPALPAEAARRSAKFITNMLGDGLSGTVQFGVDP
jgi:hypothetical protein